MARVPFPWNGCLPWCGLICRKTRWRASACSSRTSSERCASNARADAPDMLCTMCYGMRIWRAP